MGSTATLPKTLTLVPSPLKNKDSITCPTYKAKRSTFDNDARYGDPIDPDAHLKFFHSMRRVLKKGGNIYLSVQVGSTSKHKVQYRDNPDI